MAREEESNVISRDMNKDEKLKALDTAPTQIEKAYGKGSVMRLGDSRANMNTETMSIDSISLDIAPGSGGVSKGRTVEVYGPESFGKTMVVPHMMAKVQEREGIAGFIDAEYAPDSVYVRSIGAGVNNLRISQPDGDEQALEITEAMVRSGVVDIVTVDSVVTPVPRAEIGGEVGDPHVGLQARPISQALRKPIAVIGKSNCIAIFINQLHEKVSVTFGNPEAATGGRALKFYVFIRPDTHRVETLKQGREVTGNCAGVKVVKNKTVPLLREAEFDIMFGKGIPKEDDILDLAVKENTIEKSGAWFTYNSLKIGQGRGNSKQYLPGNLAVCTEVGARVRAEHELLGIEEVMEAVGASKTAAKQAETKTGETDAGAPEPV